jgi:hypothetical protein
MLTNDAFKDIPCNCVLHKISANSLCLLPTCSEHVILAPLGTIYDNNIPARHSASKVLILTKYCFHENEGQLKEKKN